MNLCNIGIYQITNTVNNKRYIGCSKRIKARWGRHRSDLKHQRHANSHLQKAYNKYGKDCFIYKIICSCPEEYLSKTEQWFLDNYIVWGTDYNMAKESKGFFGDVTKIRNYTIEQAQSMVDEFCNGKSYDEISHKYTISNDALIRIISGKYYKELNRDFDLIAKIRKQNKQNNTKGQFKPKITEQDKKNIIASTKSAKELAPIYDVTASTIRRVRRDHKRSFTMQNINYCEII